MQTSNNQQSQVRIRINHLIRVPQVRVILSDGSNGGIMSTQDALKLAQNENLDLIEINPKAAPPVVKIASFGKFKYEEKKKQAEAKKNAKQQEMKELTFKPNIAENDMDHKIDQAKSFLAEGNTVKVTCKFRGREITHPQIGRDKMDYIIKQLGELIQPNPSISLEGKFMSCVMFPIKCNHCSGNGGTHYCGCGNKTNHIAGTNIGSNHVCDSCVAKLCKQKG